MKPCCPGSIYLGVPVWGKGLTGSRNQISVGLQHEEGVGGEELIGQDHQLPLVTSLGRYSLKHGPDVKLGLH